MSLRALIVGGGIGGLCTALALSNKGIPSVVFERNRFGDTTGTGIQLSPNATRLLFQSGLKQQLLQRALQATQIVTRHWHSGRQTATVPLGEIINRHCDAPYLQILRRELIDILYGAVDKNADIELIDNEQVNSFVQSETSVSITQNETLFRGALVVGADGARSTVRKLLGQIPDPPFSNWHAWRTTIQLKPTDVILGQTDLWCGPRCHIVSYPVDSHGTVNCVFITRSSDLLQESWNQPGSLDELQAHFKGWHNDVFDLIGRVDQSKLFRWGLFRHDKLRGGWSDGRCTLVGDAGHCVLPFMAQGAALAIEDAFTLANCLGKQPRNVTQALTSFEKIRLPRSRSIQRKSFQLGLVYHLPDSLSWLRNINARWAVSLLVRNIYAFDANHLNS